MRNPGARALALLMCENALTDLDGKRSLIGLFNKVITPSLPVTIPRIVFFILLEGMRNGDVVTLEIRAEDTNEVIRRHEATLDQQQESESEIGVVMQGLTLSGEGVYLCRILCHSDCLMERRLFVATARARLARTAEQEVER